MIGNPNGLISRITGAASGIGNSNISSGNTVSSTNSAGEPQAAFQFASFSNITLGANPVQLSATNLKPPNGYALSNLQINISVTDTTGGTTAPVTPASIENVLQQLVIKASSGKPLFVSNGTFGEFQRWQQILNDNGSYAVAPTPADSATSTAYTVVYSINLKHFVADASELQGFEVGILPNTLSTRAATLNGMTSVINYVTLVADFVPVAGYVKTMYRTKQITVSSTGYVDLGTQLDRVKLSAIAADFGADSKLNVNSTFFVSVQNVPKVPYTGYQAFINAQNQLPANSYGNANHISGFFPLQAVYKAAIDGSLLVSYQANIASAPTGGGQSNTVNLYQAEQY
ncbi:MAG: hypothetical protein KGI50_06740 [Patescibacteria group bacterium]|nr:hypothetical protein [Patescibacteria group bacterium]MDE2439258.1 hypothetical protein [Patescibacteria group bacterium]